MKAANPVIPITRPWFDEADEEALIQTLRSGWVVQGPQVAEFERLFASFVGADHAVATTSCTSALHLGLIAAGVGPGDEVLVPAFTWVASANAVEYVGATPVFCDIDLDTYNIDPSEVERRVTSKTTAIMPVHLFGLCADMSALLEIAEQHGLAIVEDAACGLGASATGKHSGTFGLCGCFSFHPRKALTTGEGGMLVTDDANVARLSRSMRDHGASVTDLERHGRSDSFTMSPFEILGYNYRMTDLQGALGVAQMGKVDRVLAARREIAATYDAALPDGGELIRPHVPTDYIHGYQAYVCRVDSQDNAESDHQIRNRLMEELQSRGVVTRQGTHAVHTLSYYQQKYSLHESDYPNSLSADRQTIALPLYPEMQDVDQNRVLECLYESLKAVGFSMQSRA